MTREEILNMPAGREMNVLIAEKVMKIDLSQECGGEMYDENGDSWSCTKCSETGGWGTDFEHTTNPKHYSTDIAAAWEVVEKMRDEHAIDFSLSEGFNASFLTDEDWVNNTAGTMPLAICRAALLAVMESA